MEDFGRFSHHRDLGERRPRGAHARPARGEGGEAVGTPWPPRRRHRHQTPPDDSPRESRSLSDLAAAQRPRPPRRWRPREAWREPSTHPDGACTPCSGLLGADEAPIGDPWALPAGGAGLDRWSLSSLPSEERSSAAAAAPSRELRVLPGKRDPGDRLAAPFASQPLLQPAPAPAPAGREARGSLHTQGLKDQLDEAVLSSRDRKIVALVLARLRKAQRMRELQREAAAAWAELQRSDRQVQATLERERRQLLQRGRAQWQRGGEQRGEQRGARPRARDGHARHDLWGAPEDHDRDAQQQRQDRLERVPKPRRPGPVLQRLLWERELEQELQQELEVERMRARREAALTPKPRRPGPVLQRLLLEQDQEQEQELQQELEVERMRARREAALTPKPRRPGPVLQRLLLEQEQERELEKNLEKTWVCPEEAAPKPRRPGPVQRLRLREQELELEKNLERTLSEQCKQPSLEQQQQQPPARRLVPSSTSTITTRTTTTCPKQQQAPPGGGGGGHKQVREANLSSLVNFQARQVLMGCQVKAEELLRRLSLEQSAQRAQEQLPRGPAGPELRGEAAEQEGQCQQELEEQRRVRRRLLRRLAAEQKVHQARELRLQRREQSHHHVLKLKAEKEEKCHVEGIKEAIRKKEQRTEQLARDQGAQLRGGGY